eukprot:4335536-Prymnesium_polylepis.1
MAYHTETGTTLSVGQTSSGTSAAALDTSSLHPVSATGLASRLRALRFAPRAGDFYSMATQNVNVATDFTVNPDPEVTPTPGTPLRIIVTMSKHAKAPPSCRLSQTACVFT